MPTTCKLCTRQLVDEDIEQIAGHENRVELLEYIFEKYNLQYDAKDKLCVACQKNLKAVKLVMSRWQEAQKKQHATTVSIVKTATPLASNKQENLIKKPAAASAATASLPKNQVHPIKKTKSDNGRTQNIRQSKSPIQKKDNAVTATLRASGNPTKLKTKVETPTVKTEECEEETLIKSDDEEISHEKVRLTRALKKQREEIENRETKTMQQKPHRIIHNIGFQNKEKSDVEVQPQLKTKLEHSSAKKAKTNNDSAENSVEMEINEDENENDSESQLQSIEPIDINDIGCMMQVGCIRNANGETVAQIYEENKPAIKESESLQSCIICALCQDVITTIREFHKHIRTHLQHSYECQDCLETFNTIAIVTKHQKATDHSGINTIQAEEDQKMIFFECVVCEKVFLELYNLSRHHRDVHRAPTDRYKCTQCGSCFKYKVSLTEHIAKHMDININTISCLHCDRMFKNNYQLKRHMRIHTGEKPYECETCQKKFRHSANLIVHKRVHTGELPFKCPLCARGFSTSTHMRRHLTSCEKRFNRISKELPTMVTLSEEELRYEPHKSTKSEVVFTLNTEQIINSNQSDSLLKRSLGREGGGTKRKAVEITTPIAKNQKTQQLQKKQQIQVVQVEILPTTGKKTATILKKCKFCTKIFKEEEALRLHMITHEKTAKINCALCSKTFSDPYLFKRHRLEHIIKPSTSSSSSLKKAATKTSKHDNDNVEAADEDEDVQEIDDEDNSILLDFQIDKLEPSSPESKMQLDSHDDGVDTSTLNNFRIVTIDEM